MKYFLFYFMAFTIYLFGFSTNNIIKNNSSDSIYFSFKDNTSIKDFILSQNDKKIISLLQKNKNLIKYIFANQENFLHIAVKYKKYGLIKYLLSTNINASKQNSQGNTPLHIALYSNDPEAIGLLLKSSKILKSLGIKNYNNLTPVNLARKSKDCLIQSLFFNISCKDKVLTKPTIPTISKPYKKKNYYNFGNNKIYIGR